MSKKEVQKFMEEITTGRKDSWTKNEIVKRMAAKFDIEMEKFKAGIKAKQTASKKPALKKHVGGKTAFGKTTGSKKKLSRPSRGEFAESTAAVN